MKTLLAVLLLSAASFGQSFGPYSLTGTGCASVSVNSRATAAFQVVGTWTGTIQPQASIAGQAAVNIPVSPSTSTTQAATVTANGAFYSNVSGYSFYTLCGASITGTAKVYINLSERVH